MKVTCRFNRARVAAERGHDLDLLVRLRAPAPPAREARRPVALVPAVDVSGSMAGRKLDAVKQALERLVAHLVPGDHVGLVAFDSEVRAVVPLVEVTEARRQELRRGIARLTAGSNTNLGGGLLAAVAMLTEAHPPRGLATRVILLTDGLANEGPATGHDALVELATKRARAVSLSAFGYGADCDQALLADMAQAGRGSYAYIDSEDVVLGAFGRELGGLLATYATDVVVRVVPAVGAPFERRLGDVAWHGGAQLVVPVAVAPRREEEGVEACRVEVSWRDRDERVERLTAVARLDHVAPRAADTRDDPEVARARDERLLREAQERAELCARQRDFKGARHAIEEVLAAIDDPDLRAFASDSLLPSYADPTGYANKSMVRAGSLAVLRGTRVISTERSVAAAYHVVPSAAEAEMESSFRDTEPDSGTRR